MKSGTNVTTVAVTVLLILSVILFTFGLAYAIYYLLSLFGLPLSVGFPLPFRLLGLVLVSIGIFVGSSVMRYRRPMDVIVSTYDTFTKLLWKRPIRERTKRTEPFIPKGPYVYTRNPMYFGVVMLALGFGFVFASIPLLLWGVVVALWFSFFQIPFEEKELKALFGESYAEYKQQVPMLFPYGKRYKQETRTESDEGYPWPLG